PFDALRTFVDPSVEFGLRFENHEEDEDEPEDEDEAEPEGPGEDSPKGGAEVVSLDKWRK
ncbi:ClpXP protease specificity-enhancing factor SspB, partial [Paracoccus sp. PXZ]